MVKRRTQQRLPGEKIVVKVTGNKIGSKYETKKDRIDKRLKAFRSIVGLWEGKDTSFFDNR